MVKSLSLSRKESKATQRILSGLLLFIFPLVLAIFPMLYITGAQPPWGTLDQKPTLPFIRQRVSKENGAYRFNPEKREKKSLFRSGTIKAKKIELKEFVLGEGEFESEDSSFPISKSGSNGKKFWLELTAHAEFPYQVTHLNSWLQPRAPPYIL